MKENLLKLEAVFGIEVKVKLAENGLGLQVMIRGPQSSRTLLGVDAVCSFFSPHTDSVSR